MLENYLDEVIDNGNYDDDDDKEEEEGEVED
jgi:hypothetical protein